MVFVCYLQLCMKKIERPKRACVISLIEDIPFNTKGHLNQSEVQAAT